MTRPSGLRAAAACQVVEGVKWNRSRKILSGSLSRAAHSVNEAYITDVPLSCNFFSQQHVHMTVLLISGPFVLSSGEDMGHPLAGT